MKDFGCLCAAKERKKKCMQDLKISDLVAMQNALQSRMRGKWLPINPENGHFSLLWMFEEVASLLPL